MMTLEEMQAKRDRMQDNQQLEALWEIAMLLREMRDDQLAPGQPHQHEQAGGAQAGKKVR